MRLLSRLIAWLLGRKPEYRRAPPIAHPERLHVSTKRNGDQVWPINWNAMRERAR